MQAHPQGSTAQGGKAQGLARSASQRAVLGRGQSAAKARRRLGHRHRQGQGQHRRPGRGRRALDRGTGGSRAGPLDSPRRLGDGHRRCHRAGLVGSEPAKNQRAAEERPGPGPGNCGGQRRQGRQDQPGLAGDHPSRGGGILHRQKRTAKSPRTLPQGPHRLSARAQRRPLRGRRPLPGPTRLCSRRVGRHSAGG